MIQSEAGLLQTGEELELNFGEGLVVRGRVAWVRQRNAGIQFEAPLSALAARKILFNVVGTGLQHALQGTSPGLIARHLHPLLRWWPERIVRVSPPDVQLKRDGTVRYSHRIEALMLAAWLAPFAFATPLILR